MQTVRISEDVAQRLEALAKATNRSKSFYANKVLNDFLEDQEDIFLATQALKDKDEETYTLDEVIALLENDRDDKQ